MIYYEMYVGTVKTNNMILYVYYAKNVDTIYIYMFLAKVKIGKIISEMLRS